MPYPNSPAAAPIPGAAPTDVLHLLQAGAALSEPRKNPDPDGRAFVVAPVNYEVHDLPTLLRPARPVSRVKLRDAASFVAYVSDHRVDRTRIYATLEPARFLAVFDDHYTAAATDHDEATDEQADWREFRAEFTLPPSREWTTWTGANRKPVSQVQFAEFLQDQLPDVVKPEGSDLMTMILNFEAASSGQFVSAQRLQDGSANIVWRDEKNAAGTVKLPEIIELAIPVFENEAPRPLSARLRYRIKDASLAVWYELIRPHKVLEAAFRETWGKIAEGTGVQILLGTPE